MGYRLDDREVEISSRRMKRIAYGVTGDVYKYQNKALKIFKKNKPIPMDLETAQYLTNINTSRILLPRNILFHNDAFSGYTYKLVKKGSIKGIINLEKDELIENISIIENEIELLSHKRVLLNGIDPSNTIYNGKLYLSDPSKYTILNTSSIRELNTLNTLNKYQFYLLLSTLFISGIKDCNYSQDTCRRFKELLELKDSEENSSKYLYELLGSNESIKQMVKRM